MGHTNYPDFRQSSFHPTMSLDQYRRSHFSAKIHATLKLKHSDWSKLIQWLLHLIRVLKLQRSVILSWKQLGRIGSWSNVSIAFRTCPKPSDTRRKTGWKTWRASTRSTLRRSRRPGRSSASWESNKLAFSSFSEQLVPLELEFGSSLTRSRSNQRTTNYNLTFLLRKILTLPPLIYFKPLKKLSWLFLTTTTLRMVRVTTLILFKQSCFAEI